MQKIASLDGLVPERLRPMTRKIVLEDYRLDIDIGFHEFEIGNPQRLLVTVEVWVDERSFSADDEAGSAWDYDFSAPRSAPRRRPPLQSAGDAGPRDL